jgi:hypothetical protein
VPSFDTATTPRRSTLSLEVMKIGRLMLIAAAVAAGLVLAVAGTPPFPEPDTLIDRPYESIVAVLGRPDGGIPDKFVAWSRNRGQLRWDFEVYPAEAPALSKSIPNSVSRCLWIPALGIPIRCKTIVRARMALPNSST